MDPKFKKIRKLKSSISKLQSDIKFNLYTYDAHVKLIAQLYELYLLYKDEELECHKIYEEKKAALEQTAEEKNTAVEQTAEQKNTDLEQLAEEKNTAVKQKSEENKAALQQTAKENKAVSEQTTEENKAVLEQPAEEEKPVVELTFEEKKAALEDAIEDKKAAFEQTVIAFKKLRQSRQNMCTVYPLTTELWMKWLDDEFNMDQPLFSHNVIQDIFSKATVDYISVDIWCRYIDYLCKRLQDGHCTNETIREVFEKAVTNCGLHYQDGYRIWQAYKDFELQLLVKAEKPVEENSDKINIEQFKTQVVRLAKLYKREISIPSIKHGDLLTGFKTVVCPRLERLKSLTNEKSFISMSEIENISKLATANIYKIRMDEEYLLETKHSFDAYETYIKRELNSGLSNPARIQCIFERAIVYHCLRGSIWLDYIDFLNNVIKLPDLIISTCKRALRNVSWDCRINIKYALILEQESCNVDEIRTVYDAALQKYSCYASHYCNLLISYLSFEKRTGENIIEKKPKVYQMIQDGISLMKGLDHSYEVVLEFVLFWIDVERFWFNSEHKVKDIWKYMLANHKSLWGPALTFARTSENTELVEEMLSIIVLYFPEDVEMLSRSLIFYENTLGSFDSLNRLLKKVSLYLPSRMQVRKTKECLGLSSKIEHKNRLMTAWLRNAEDTLFSLESPNLELSMKNNKRPHPHEVALESKVTQKTNKGVKKIYLGDDIEIKQNVEQKNVKISDVTMIGPVEVKQNVEQKNVKMSDDTVSMVGSVEVKQNVEQNNVKTSDDSVPIIGPVLPSGFLSKRKGESEASLDEEDSPPSKKMKTTDNIPDSESGSAVGSHPVNTTVFVSNLHPATKETDLKTIFSRAGEVQQVDLRKQRGGKIFAFITFATPEEAQKAFELEHTPLFNRPLYVSEFKFTKNTERNTSGSAKYSQSQEKNKLFVTNLHKATTQIDLEKLFNQYGDMTSLRLINKKGSSKQFAYVEYASAEAATRYLKAVNNTVVRGLPIIVDFSNPSVSNQSNKPRQLKLEEDKPEEGNSQDSKTEEPTLNSGNEEAFVKPKPVKLGLVPFQARGSRSQQSIPKSVTTKTGPSVRINLATSSTNSQSTSSEESQVSANNGEQSSAAAVSSARKSNEEFRKMFFKN